MGLSSLFNLSICQSIISCKLDEGIKNVLNHPDTEVRSLLKAGTLDYYICNKKLKTQLISSRFYGFYQVDFDKKRYKTSKFVCWYVPAHFNGLDGMSTRGFKFKRMGDFSKLNKYSFEEIIESLTYAESKRGSGCTRPEEALWTRELDEYLEERFPDEFYEMTEVC